MKYNVSAVVQVTTDFEFDTDQEPEAFIPTGAKPDDPDRLDPTDPDVVHDWFVDQLDDQDYLLAVLTDHSFTTDRVSDVEVKEIKPAK